MIKNKLGILKISKDFIEVGYSYLIDSFHQYRIIPVRIEFDNIYGLFNSLLHNKFQKRK